MRHFFRDILVAIISGIILLPIGYYWGHEATLKQTQNMTNSPNATMQQSTGNGSLNVSLTGNNLNRSPVTFESQAVASSSIPLVATTILYRSDQPDRDGLYLTNLKIDVLSSTQAKLNGSLPLLGFMKCAETASTSRPFSDVNFPEIHSVLEIHYNCYSKETISPDNLIFWH